MALEKERKRRQEEAKVKQRKARSSIYDRLHCSYRLACVSFLLDLACMGFHVFLFYHDISFSRCDSIFSIALPFLDSFDEMDYLIHMMWDGWIGFEAKWGGSPN